MFWMGRQSCLFGLRHKQAKPDCRTAARGHTDRRSMVSGKPAAARVSGRFGIKLAGFGVALGLWALALSAWAGQVCDIPGDWKPKDMRKIMVVEVAASSALSAEGGPYAPNRAVDGNRGTKWVASVEPSPAAPQWIRLELVRPRLVTAVAVFGERIGNDGIEEAEVQVAGAKPGEFRTVAAITDAKSASWLATFDPVKTTAVRLRITRSSGPSSHTDVYEVELYAPSVAPAALKQYAGEVLAGCAASGKQLAAVAEKLAQQSATLPGLSEAVEATHRVHQQLAHQFARWDTLAPAERAQLVTNLEGLEVQTSQLAQWLPRAATAWSQRAAEIAPARKAAKETGKGAEVVSAREGSKVRVSNDRVSVVLDNSDGRWQATWLGGVDAAVRGASFAVQAGGVSLAPKGIRAQVASATDRLGPAVEIRQRWGTGIEIERWIRVYPGRPQVLVGAEIHNRTDRDVVLGPAVLIEISQAGGGWWHLATPLRAPAAPARPVLGDARAGIAACEYHSEDVLALAPRPAPGALVLGMLSDRQGRPSVRARFEPGQGGTALSVGQSLGGRVLAPGKSLVLDPAWISVEDDCLAALERYGGAVAAMSPQAPLTGAHSLWCSWYPLRMTISQEIALAHAEIIARHFKPLGMEVVQLDHGWQRGNICGDWFPNERFPHGLKWLAEQLHQRYGLKLGLWIAPTQVAFTSQTFREHPEWLTKGADGKPASTGRWYWAPNPEMALLDAGHPEAERWIEETFRRLSSEGARYYKIDFIAGSPSLRRAMEAIRRGAGPDAWIRYCQTPPLVSAGLANSAYQGPDTLDAGFQNWIEPLRANAALLAASYWANDRLYHREICDMSVGKGASVEEARFKMTMMLLGGCSISFSDDFRQLDLPRIRMMQQCLPPGNPPSRPLDLFDAQRPALWHMHCQRLGRSWDAVGVLNFDDTPQERSVDLALLGLPETAEVVAFEFWEGKFLGSFRQQARISLPPRTARVLLLHPRPARPEVIATDMHVLGGYHELRERAWDAERLTLSGRCRRMPGISGRLYVYVPDGYRPQASTGPGAGRESQGPAAVSSAQFAAAKTAGLLTHAGGPLWCMEIAFDQAEADFSVSFQRSEK